jgi:hypothetical protein
MKTRVLSLLGVLLLISATAQAQVPTFQEVTGHEFGERITKSFQMARYLERLADASDRVTVQQIGESWQGRPLMMAIVTAPENHARLDEIQRNAQRLGDPRTTSPEEARRIIDAGHPAVIWFGGSIHGFELSGTEGVLMLLEHLTTRDDPQTMEMLRNTVVLIDPMLNPDGRDAFAHLNHNHMGARINADNNDWANTFTSWQGLQFRTGHYFFDTNRDWFAHTQRETQARVPIFQQWRPQAGVDAHEMGANVEFYIDPPTDPVGPFFPEFASRWFERFGAAHARAFDQAGVDYMAGEMFNYFYPAYTTSYLSYQGAVGMLYEQGSSRGLALTRSDGTVRTLADAARQQYVAARAATELAARERAPLLREYYEGHREAIADGQRGVRRYVIPPSGDPQITAELGALLTRNGIEVQRLNRETALAGLRDRTGNAASQRTFPAGTLVVDAAQPRNRLIRVLLEPHVPVPEQFLEDARRRVERGENPRFYDITSWSLPLLFNVEAFSSTDGRQLSADPVPTDESIQARYPAENPAYAYLIDGRQAAGTAALYHLRDRGHRVGLLTNPTRIQGQDFASGTGIVWVGQAEPNVHADVRELADAYGLHVEGVGTGYAEGRFPSLGSGDVRYMTLPRIALLAEDPVQAYSFGWAWYTLDRQYDIPTSVLRAQSIGNVRLDDYNVIIVPEVTDTTALARIAGRNGMNRLAQWVREGGTLVTVGSGTEVARQLGLIRLRSWHDLEENAAAQRVDVPGAFARTVIDHDNWLTAGYDDGLPVLMNSTRVYLAPDGAPAGGRRTPVRVAGENFRIAGHLWPESVERLPDAVFAYEERVGRGRVISFAEDVNFRAYWRGANRLFLNAVLFGPSAP